MNANSTTRRKHVHYSSVEQVEQLIDRAHNESIALQKQADGLDTKADTARDTKRGTEFISGWRLEAKRLRGKAARKIDVRCKFLKAKLAELQTMPLPL